MDSDLKTTKAFQASDELTRAKKHFSSAIQLLQDIHQKVMQLAKESASFEFEDLNGLTSARVVEILKIIQRSEMKVVFFGRTNNGKSTVINALLKSKVLPSGWGSTTAAICSIRGWSKPEGGLVLLEGCNELLSVQSAEDLASHMENQHAVQIYWSTAQCSFVKGDIVLVDCPGMNAGSDMDDKVIECCTDADVFVYVANGTTGTTFETAERGLLANVKDKISSPSNTFILFNHWDRVEEDGEEQAIAVKQQQLSKVTRIMVEELEIFTEEMVKERTFFVSAKQAISNAVGCAVSGQQAGSHTLREFARFEESLQECLIEAAIKTKFGRHYRECRPIVASVIAAVTSMKHRWMEEREAREDEKKRIQMVIKGIDARMERFDQIYRKTVNEALEKVDEMCEEFHNTVKEKLPEEISKLHPEGGFDPKKTTQYCEEMRKLLQKELEDKERQDLKGCWSSEAASVVKLLADPLVKVEEEVSSLEAEYISSQPGSQLVDFAQLPVIEIARKPFYSMWRKTQYFLAGGGLGTVAGAAAGLGLAVGVEAVSFGLATPIAAAIGATALGGLSFAVMKPDTMTEDQAKEEIRKKLITYLDQDKDDKKKRYKDGLREFVRSSTDASCRRVEDQKRGHEKAVAEMTSTLQVLHDWLSEARRIEVKVKEMEWQLDGFKDTFLLNKSKYASV